jgi:hypothetical protein
MAWNLLIISAYILASFFSYGYIYTVTQSLIGAYGGGIIYGMSGFMISHIEHTNMIHSVAWLPLSLWALEKLRHKISKFWVFLAVISLGLNILAGHPQMAVYSLALIILYSFILGKKAAIKTGKYYQIIGLILILGITLASLQLIPTLELSRLSVRDEIDFRFYTDYTLPPQEAVKLIFPYFFGGSHSQLYNMSYFGSWTLTETTGYVGISGLILATVGFICHRRQILAQFWLVIVLFSLFIAFGESTPLAWLSYHIPIYNKFRCLARHFCQMSLGISILAGMGIQSLQNLQLSPRLFLKVIIAFISILLTALFYIYSYIKPNIITNQNLNSNRIFNLTQNPALAIPLIIFIVAILTISLVLFIIKKYNFKPIAILLICLVILDLSSFSYFSVWKEQYGDYEFILAENHPYALKYRELLQSENQRMISLEGVLGGMENIRPNLSRKWQISNASIYNPLILKRYAHFLNADYASGVQGSSWADNNNQSFNLMGIRYVFMSQMPPSKLKTQQGILWNNDDLNINEGINLGKKCAAESDKITKINYPLSQPLPIQTIAIVNHLGCSPEIPDNTDVLRITLTDLEGNIITKTLKAGQDTSEFAYDSVRDAIAHSKAENIFETTADGNQYLSLVHLDKSKTIKNMQLEYLLEGGSISIKKITLIDEEKQKFYPFNDLENFLSNQSRWHHLEDINKTTIYENKDALPRVWLVPKVIALKPDEIIRTIKTSSLPDRSIYQPQKIALVEEKIDFEVEKFDPQAQATIINHTPTSIEIETNSQSPSFLVLSDTYYPGWQGRIDGKKTKVFVTNYWQRGIVLPKGNHRVKFDFKPLSFHLGLGLSLATFFGLGYLILPCSRSPKIED